MQYSILKMDKGSKHQSSNAFLISFIFFRSSNAYYDWLCQQFHSFHLRLLQSSKTLDIPHNNERNRWWFIWLVRVRWNWLSKVLHISIEMLVLQHIIFLPCRHLRLFCFSRVCFFWFLCGWKRKWNVERHEFVN